jgi:G6PDH family F420-dependent oxidoreductase
MVELGYTLSAEEHQPDFLVRYAQMAEDAGFTFASISDHYHPWIDRQGHSPFVWAVLGGVAQATTTLRVQTGVTCPTIRIHPAVIAQAAATVAAMMPGRFVLGVGTGENLNEHILGDRWPETEVRQEMLEEAVQVIRLLWQGGNQSHHGKHYTVENARLYTLPPEPAPIYFAAAGEKSAVLAGRIGDGLISTAPAREVVETFEQNGSKGKPKVAQVTVCWAKSEAEGIKTAHEIWPNSAIPGELSQELPSPAHFEQAAKLVTEDAVAKTIACGPDPEKHVAEIQKYIDAGFDHLYVHQVGPDQEGFLNFYKHEILPRYR